MQTTAQSSPGQFSITTCQDFYVTPARVETTQSVFPTISASIDMTLTEMADITCLNRNNYNCLFQLSMFSLYGCFRIWLQNGNFPRWNMSKLKLTSCLYFLDLAEALLAVCSSHLIAICILQYKLLSFWLRLKMPQILFFVPFSHTSPIPPKVLRST